MNRLLTIAQEEAAKSGHVIESFTRHVVSDVPIYSAECVVCGADVRVVCTAQQYKRTGTAYTCRCKPG
jgi:hypothetical protein